MSPRSYVLDDDASGNWASVSVGRDHTCALDRSGRAFCWGANVAGQLGVAVVSGKCTAQKTPCATEPVAVETTLRFRMIAAGATHTCAIGIDWAVYCWGSNRNGALGEITEGGPSLVKVPLSATFGFVSAGFDHTCALRTDGAAYCWGLNDRGQLGKGDLTGSSFPVRVRSGAAFASISAGQDRTCARTIAGNAMCWGAIWVYQQAGLDYTRSQPTPEGLPDVPPMSAISVGGSSTCGVDVNGVARCWEGNAYGQLGSGGIQGSALPLPVAGGQRFVSVTSGVIQACGIAITGAAYCWGDDVFGELGVPPSALSERCSGANPCSTVPVPVFGRTHFVSLSTGLGSHVCGVTDRGAMYCWGLSVNGQRGDGTSAYRSVIPILVHEPASH